MRQVNIFPAVIVIIFDINLVVLTITNNSRDAALFVGYFVNVRPVAGP